MANSNKFLDSAGLTKVWNRIKTLFTKHIGTDNKWSRITAYIAGDYVVHDDNLWQCKLANSAQTPAEGTYWTQVSLKSLKEDISEVKSEIDSRYHDFGITSSLSEMQSDILSFITSTSNFVTDMKINFTTSFSKYTGGVWYGHLYKTSNSYFTGVIANYSGGLVQFSYKNGIWEHTGFATK